MRLAHQHIQSEQREIEERRRREAMIGEEEARRLQQQEMKRKGGTLDDLPTYDSLGFSLPPPPPREEEEEDECVDEMARQEEEDARLARELLENEEREAERRVSETEITLFNCCLINRGKNKNKRIL